MNETKNIRVVFFGTPSFVTPVAEAIAKQFDLVGVVTSPDAPVGRKKIITPSPLKKWYMEYLLSENKEGVILTPEELTEDTAIKLRKLHPDLFVVAAYGKLVPKIILDIPTHGSINIHPSFLPTYRGPSPIQNALLNADTKLGISIIQMDEELDHGPILFQWNIPISPEDTFASLHTKSFQDASEMLPEVIEKYAKQDIIPLPQDDSRATYTHKITKQDGFIDISNIGELSESDMGNLRLELARKIRAFYPWPTAWTTVRIKNNESRILKFLPNGMIQIEGKKPVKIRELLNGYPELKEIIEKLLLHHDS